MPPSSERKEAFTNHPSVERIASSEDGDEELSRHRTYCPLCRARWFDYLDKITAAARQQHEIEAEIEQKLGQYWCAFGRDFGMAGSVERGVYVEIKLDALQAFRWHQHRDRCVQCAAQPIIVVKAQHDVPSPCLSQETLDAMVKGKMTEREKRIVLPLLEAHTDQCAACNDRVWVAHFQLIRHIEGRGE